MDDEGRQVERQLKDGLSRRTTIGVALGRLMERYGMDQEQAFAHLSRMSSEQNRKVYVLALELAESGEAHLDPGPLDPACSAATDPGPELRRPGSPGVR